jgi:hypothetical protein
MIMENNENIAGLGKDHDKAARENDIAKKQSEAKPGAENLDMNPNSVNKNGNSDFLQQSDTLENNEQISNIHEKAQEYADEEHSKAKNWEDTGE